MSNIDIDKLDSIKNALVRFAKNKYQTPDKLIIELHLLIDSLTTNVMVNLASSLSIQDTPVNKIIENKFKELELFSKYDWKFVNGCKLISGKYSSCVGLGTLFSLNLKTKEYYINRNEFNAIDKLYVDMCSRIVITKDDEIFSNEEMYFGEDGKGLEYFLMKEYFNNLEKYFIEFGFVYSDNI